VEKDRASFTGILYEKFELFDACAFKTLLKLRPILDLKVATVARDVARLCATFRDFPRLWFATLRDFIENIANDRKTLILMTSFFFVLRPSATSRDLPRIFATLVRNFGRDCAKVKSRIGLSWAILSTLKSARVKKLEFLV
jgi:hypothetical protein